MKIALLQFDLCWNNVRANIEKALFLINKVDADLYVLPEMWSTGFVIRPQGVAEEESSSEALKWMKDTAFTKDCAISGSLAVSVEDGSFRNRHYFVSKNSCTFYDKKHCFTLGKEHLFYQKGDTSLVVSYKGIRFLLQTCYDLRFPCFSRYGRAGEYDAIIYVANWPSSRRQAWDILLRARAIENQCYVVGVNRVGNDTTLEYNGGSVIVDPLGNILTDCGEKECVSSVDISLETLQKIRSRFKFLDDRDRL